jgi:hypothetical protein
MLLLITLLTVVPALIIQGQSGQPLLNRQVDLSDSSGFCFLDAFEYTFDIGGKQIFPKDTVKRSITTEYNPSVYKISTLQLTMRGHSVNASDVEIHMVPTRINEAIYKT